MTNFISRFVLLQHLPVLILFVSICNCMLAIQRERDGIQYLFFQLSSANVIAEQLVTGLRLKIRFSQVIYISDETFFSVTSAFLALNLCFPLVLRQCIQK